MRTKPVLPLEPFAVFFKDYEPSVRVGKSAREQLRKYIEEKAYDIAKRAVRIAQHRGSKTVTGSDVDIVEETLRDR